YYLYNISAGDFSYKGRITHVPDGTPVYEVRGEYFILRGFYIGNNLYTISGSQLQVHDLATLAKKGSLSFGQ
ncbi:MAG TPA: beta-propeller domain-containing protein, partial [Clostridia bacterium]